MFAYNMQLTLQCHGLPSLAIPNEKKTSASKSQLVQMETNTCLDCGMTRSFADISIEMQWMSYGDFFRNPFVHTFFARSLFICLIAECPVCYFISSCWHRHGDLSLFQKKQKKTKSNHFRTVSSSNQTFELQKMLKIKTGKTSTWNEKNGFLAIENFSWFKLFGKVISGVHSESNESTTR